MNYGAAAGTMQPYGPAFATPTTPSPAAQTTAYGSPSTPKPISFQHYEPQRRGFTTTGASPAASNIAQSYNQLVAANGQYAAPMVSPQYPVCSFLSCDFYRLIVLSIASCCWLGMECHRSAHRFSNWIPSPCSKWIWTSSVASTTGSAIWPTESQWICVFLSNPDTCIIKALCLEYYSDIPRATYPNIVRLWTHSRSLDTYSA
jgi:hypothetical protein